MQVQDLLKGPLAALGDDAKAYWTSIALRGAGAPLATWQEPLRNTLAKSRNKLFKARAERTLNAPVIDAAAALSPRAASIVDNVAQRMQQTNSPTRSGLLTTPVTYILLVAIGLVYVLEEMRGGAENLRVLVDMGAMWPPYVEQRGEWWRLITAIFLHLGWLHTLVNAFMLWVLGRPCELSLGSIPMLLVYLLGGVASTGFVLWLALAGYTDPAVLIGASGAIMALFGGDRRPPPGELAALARSARQTRAGAVPGDPRAADRRRPRHPASEPRRARLGLRRRLPHRPADSARHARAATCQRARILTSPSRCAASARRLTLSLRA